MRVIFAGGGTGGHINPAISIADYAKAQDENFEAIFIGTKTGLETKLVPKAGYKLEFIDIKGFDRKHLLKNVEVIKKLIESRAKMKKIIKDFKPDCIVCTGGYVSGPVTMAAKAAKIPALIHEQNVYPGLTVKGSEKYVDYVCPQIYWSFEHSICPFDKTVKEWAKLKKSDTVKLYIGIAAYKAGISSTEAKAAGDIGWSKTSSEMKKQVQYGRSTNKVDGYMFYRYDNLISSKVKKELSNLKKVLK